MSDEHNPDGYYGYDRSDAVGPTSFQEHYYNDPIYYRYGLNTDRATGEAVFHYRPVEQTPYEVLAEGQWSPEQGWDAGTEWSDEPTPECNVDTMYGWVAHMSDEHTFALADAWSQAAGVLRRTALALQRQAEALAATWQSPAAEEFLLRIGAALTSLDDWRDVALDNAAGLRRIAEAIQYAQDPDHLPRVYEQYRERATHIAYQKADEVQLWREDPDSDHARERADRFRYEAIGLAREEYHHEAMGYTRPIADTYIEVRFTLLGQGRRYEGPVLPDLGMTRMDAALSALHEAMQRRIDGAMAGLHGLGAVPMAAPPMPDFVPPPAIPSIVVPQFMGSPGGGMPAPPAPLSPPTAGAPDGVLAGVPVAPVAPPVPTAPSLPAVPAQPAMPGVPPVGLPPGITAPPGRTVGGPAAPPRGAAPALPGATASPGVPPPQGPPGATRRAERGAAHAGRPAGAALPGAIPPPAVGHPGRATGRASPPESATPRLHGATGAPGAPRPTTASPGAPPPPALPGQSTRPSGPSVRSANPSRRSAGGGAGRTGAGGGGTKAAPALPGSTAPRTGSGGAGAPPLGARGAADRSRGRTEERRPEDVLHVPGQADDALWTVDTPKGRLSAQQPKPDQPPPASV